MDSISTSNDTIANSSIIGYNHCELPSAYTISILDLAFSSNLIHTIRTPGVVTVLLCASVVVVKSNDISLLQDEPLHNTPCSAVSGSI